MNRLTLLAAALAVPVLAGCVETTTTTSAAAPGNQPEADAQRACLSAVARETGNSAVRVQSSSFSEAGTEVIVLVGADGGPTPPAPWRCIAYRDGSTAGVEFLGSEGFL